MGSIFGNRITDDNIVFHIDFANRNSFAPNLLNYSSWTVSTGDITADGTKYGITQYMSNGSLSENIRVTGSDPFGYTGSVVWKSSTIEPYGTSDADGGWQTGQFPIDITKMYRFSVWTKRDAMSVGVTYSGSFYLGHMERDSTGLLTYSVAKTDGSTTNNPYFHITPNTLSLSNIQPPYLGGLDVWTLVVGHVWPTDSSIQLTMPGTGINGLPTNGNHPDSGIWTLNSGKIGNLSVVDRIWYKSTVYSNHRSYHYYSGDYSATQSFIYPRVDLVDGLEPTIDELLTGTEPVKDISKNQNTIYPLNTTNFDKEGKSINLSGVEKEVICGTISSTFSVYSMSIWFNPTSQITSTTQGQALIQLGSPNIIGPFVIYLGDTTANVTNEVITISNNGSYFTSVVSPTIINSGWQNLVITWQGSFYLIYLNGVLQNTTSGGSGHAQPNYNVNYVALGGRKYSGQPWGYFFQGKIGSVVVYNRNLTSTEILFNYNAMKSKYGLN